MVICQIVWNIPYVLEYFESGISQNILKMATKMVIARRGKILDMVDAELHRSELGVNMWDVNKKLNIIPDKNLNLKFKETSVRADAELHMYEVKMWVVKMKAKVLRYAQAIKTCQNQWNKSILQVCSCVWNFQQLLKPPSFPKKVANKSFLWIWNRLNICRTPFQKKSSKQKLSLNLKQGRMNVRP